MTIYVDVLVFVNVFITYFILLSAKALLHLKTRVSKILFASLTGGIASLAALLPEFTFLVSVLYKLAVTACIVFIAFEKCVVKEFVKRCIVFFTVSFCLCGIMILIQSIFKTDTLIIANDIVYFHISPIVLLGSTVICYLILRIFDTISKRRYAAHHIYSIKFYKQGTCFCFDGRIDTGCSLTEPFSGNDVIIVEKALLNNFVLQDKDTRVIPFSSLGGKGIIKGFRPDDIYINNKRLNKEIYIGICENIITGNVKAIINSNIIESEELLCKE